MPLNLPPETLARLRRHDLLRPLIKRELISETVSSDALPSEQSVSLLKRYTQQANLKEERDLVEHLRLKGMSLDDLQWQVELTTRIQQYSEKEFGGKAESRFLQRKQALDVVVYSLLRVRDGFLAQELYHRIADGEASFTELASQYSEGPEKASHGIVGPAPLQSRAHPILAERLRITTPGEVLEPFQIQGWWLVVRLESYKPAVFDQAMATQMAMELFEEWLEQETSRRIAALELPVASGIVEPT